MKYGPRGIFPVFLMWVGLAVLMTTPLAQAQKSRSRTRDAQGIIKWAEWKALKCDRCLGKGKTDCGTCNGGRKKLDVKCGECRGKKKATCRDCYGKGKYADPFVTVPCGRCDGRGAISCMRCNARGQIFFSDGKKGAKCKVCSKKGYFKCWTCKGKGSLTMLQIEGVGYAAATELQLKELHGKIKPLADKLDAFTGLQTPDKKKSFFRKEDYEDVMKLVVDLFPDFKNDVKKTLALGPKALKHKELNDYQKLPGLMLQRSAAAAQRFMIDHLNALNACLDTFTQNRRQEELNKRRKAKTGGGG